MNAMTLELKEVCQTVLPSSSVPLPTQPNRLGANPKIVAKVARWFFPSWEPLEPTFERATVGPTCGDLETKCESHACKDPPLPLWEIKTNTIPLQEITSNKMGVTTPYQKPHRKLVVALDGGIAKRLARFVHTCKPSDQEGNQKGHGPLSNNQVLDVQIMDT
jgi:hypothetical protein